MFKTEALAPGSREAAQLSADTVIRATRAMGGTLAGLGSCDLAAGIAFLRPYHQPPAFAWIALNLVDPASGQPLFAPVAHRQVGGVRVAILGLVDPAAVPQPPEGSAVKDWRTCLPEALARIKGQADLIVLLSNYALAENQEIAWQHGEIDLILQSGHVIGNQSPVLSNQALIAQTEIRGKYLGMLDIDWQGHGRWSESPNAPKDGKPLSSYTNRFIALKPSLSVDPEVEAMVRETQHKLDQGQQRESR